MKPTTKIQAQTVPVIYEDSPDFWRGLTEQMLKQAGVEVSSDGGDITLHQAHECAGLVELAAWRIVRNFKALSKQCAANDPAAVTMAMAIGLDRTGFLSDVSVRVTGSTKWVDDKAEQQVAPPESELPFKGEDGQ